MSLQIYPSTPVAPFIGAFLPSELSAVRSVIPAILPLADPQSYLAQWIQTGFPDDKAKNSQLARDIRELAGRLEHPHSAILRRAVERVNRQNGPRRISGLDALICAGAALMLGFAEPPRFSIPMPDITVDRERGAASMWLPDDVWFRMGFHPHISEAILAAPGDRYRTSSLPNPGYEEDTLWMRNDANGYLSGYKIFLRRDLSSRSIRISAVTEAGTGGVEAFDTERTESALRGILYFLGGLNWFKADAPRTEETNFLAIAILLGSTDLVKHLFDGLEFERDGTRIFVFSREIFPPFSAFHGYKGELGGNPPRRLLEQVRHIDAGFETEENICWGVAPGSYQCESPATLPAEVRTAWERYLHLFARPIDTITPELDIAARLGAAFSRSRRAAILSKADGDWRLLHREGEICIVCDEPLHDTDGNFYLRTDHQFERPVMVLDGRGMGYYRFIFGPSGELLCGLVRKNVSSSGSHHFFYGMTSSHRRDLVAIAFDPQLRGQTVSSEWHDIKPQKGSRGHRL